MTRKDCACSVQTQPPIAGLTTEYISNNVTFFQIFSICAWLNLWMPTNGYGELTVIHFSCLLFIFKKPSF